MFSWLFSPTPAVETSPEERFEMVMRRLDAIEQAIRSLRVAVMPMCGTDDETDTETEDGAEAGSEPGLGDLDDESASEIEPAPPRIAM